MFCLRQRASMDSLEMPQIELEGQFQPLPANQQHVNNDTGTNVRQALIQCYYLYCYYK